MSRYRWMVSALVLVSFATAAWALDDILIADFEADDYESWTATGEAFGPGPATGTLPGQMTVSGYRGERLVNTFYHGDGTTGTLSVRHEARERRKRCRKRS